MRAMKKTTRNFFIIVLVGIFAVLDFIAKKKAEPTDIDTENPYIDNLDLLEVKYRNVYIDGYFNDRYRKSRDFTYKMLKMGYEISHITRNGLGEELSFIKAG